MAIKTIKNIKKIKSDHWPLIIGYFGCIHIMHQQLLTKYHHFNVLTFTDLFNKRSHQIYNYKSRLNNIQKFNPKNIYVLDVSSRNMDGMKFINTILKKLNPSEILVGSDFKFGSDNLGTKILKNYFKVTELTYNPDVSTKKIYDFIKDGKVESANDYMSFYLYYEGRWVGGLKQGKKLGYPTINMINERPFVLPEGSYVTLITIGNKKYKAVSFVGKSKTLRHDRPVVETHVFDAKIRDKKLYPFWIRNHIKVEFLKFIRSNLLMPTIDSLKEAIAKDIIISKKYFKEQGI